MPVAALADTATVIAAAADTTSRVGRALSGSPEGWFPYLEGWHDFFLLTGTAAVTLAGLLFVAISLHVESLVADGHEHLLQLARVTLMSFVFVLVLSLEVLIPAVPYRVLAGQMIVLGVVFSIATARTLLFARGTSHQHFTLARFRRRLIVPLLGYLWIAFCGWLFVRSHEPSALTTILGGVILLLVNALSTSWELLVRVARVRHADKQAKAASKPPID